MPPITIKAKFDIGDTVYYILCRNGYNDLNKTCPVCNGTGKYASPSFGEIEKCPGISGYACINGKVHAMYNNYYKPVADVITGISINEDHKIIYDMGNFFPCSYEDELYATIEEAQAACDWRNAQNGSQPIPSSE